MSDKLFNAKPKKTIYAYDLFDKKHKRNLKDFKFRVSIYGVLIRGDQILVQRHPKLKIYGLPGGGMEIGESINDSLIREFEEETGVIVKKGKLLNITEDYFTFKGEDAHSILITYKVSYVSGKILLKGNHDDTGEVKFMNLDKLTKKNTQRVFWKTIKIIKDK